MLQKTLSGLIFIIVAASFAAAAGEPHFQNYPAPFPKCGGDAAEPSIGVNRSTGNVMMQSGLETLRITFNDSVTPATAKWRMTQPLITSLLSLDPIGFTDATTGRTFVSQLDAACSLTTYSDDDGATWNLSVGCGIPAGLDHQTMGSGPYNSNPLAPNSYPTAIYYCSQSLLLATCARSDDGGFLFGLGVPIYLFTQCGGRHGHVKVAPDGTVYVPNASCGGKQAVVVSENNGLSWSVRMIPGSTSGFSDPSVAIGAGNTVYFAFEDSAHHMRVATSTNRGVTWSSITDLGKIPRLMNGVFPAAVAGDDDRAAVAFLGSKTPGDYEDSNFAGIWHLYVASTFDRGANWTVTDVTPNDPVQYGSIAAGGSLEPAARHLTVDMVLPLLDRGDRNLLDFIDATVDKQGRVLIAYADGCVDNCVTNPSANLSRSALGTIARQSGGKRLYAQYDSSEPAKPAAPELTGTRDESGVHLSWSLSDDGGLSIRKYKIYRSSGTLKPRHYRNVSADSHSFLDSSVEEGVTYTYSIKAVNSLKAGPPSNEITQ